MRVVELHAGAGAYPQKALMSRPTQLRSAAIAETAMGGYLVLRSRTRRRPQGRPASRLIVRRAQISGLMCMTLTGVLALFALGGPAGCQCDADMARLAYAKQMPLATPGVSPISTSAITVAELPTRQHAHRSDLLPANITPVTPATPKRVHLAAPMIIADDEDGTSRGAPAPGALKIAKPSVPKVVAVHTSSAARVAGYVASAETPRPSHIRHEHKQSKRRVISSRSPAGRRAPRWAGQMFDTNWQKTAFSYVR